jgi:hypothetical protein
VTFVTIGRSRYVVGRRSGNVGSRRAAPRAFLFVGGAAPEGNVTTALPRSPLIEPRPTSDVEPLVGLLAGLAIVVGAFLPWIGPFGSYRLPIVSLFGISATSTEPSLLWALLALGATGILTSITPDRAKARVVAGLFVVAIMVLFFAQAQSALLFGVNFTDIAGTGAWLVLFGGVALVVSPLTRYAGGGRLVAVAILAMLAAWTGWQVTHRGDGVRLPFAAVRDSQQNVLESNPEAACNLVTEADAAHLFGEPAIRIFPAGQIGCEWAPASAPHAGLTLHAFVAETATDNAWMFADMPWDELPKPISGLGERARLGSTSPLNLYLEFADHGRLVSIIYDTTPYQPANGMDQPSAITKAQRQELIALARRADGRL